MIDLHCHILHGIDDGAKTIEDSLQMAKQAVSEGIHTIVATPHHQNGQYINEKNEIIQRVERLNTHLHQENIPLTILPGQESRIYGEIIKDYQDDKILTLNQTDKYLFLELPSSQVPKFTEKLVYDIQSEGLTPIIVHPERNSRLIEDPDILYSLVNKGVLTQVTASSLTGRFGKKIKKFSMDLIQANLTHMIASDAHNLSGRNFYMQEASELISSEYGIDTLYMFHENAEAVIKGYVCFQDTPQQVKKKKFLGIF
ncbi:tyrosine-protein phosphatase [Priestia megaterium]|uniref:tyrosine-protein phosphatase n=1 Tax=Priestia megaterium TaxID=1404 RepID=UPI00211B998C|nr:CpsB/CapC family capsule biosynthesis tyrosine phosphatase [Priestia megaterium]MED4263419.1 tyrosine protein phosphatase [Priestia megaterium]MED4276701.1 tyrosine protein phosphatase [Priestia megaterium]MED4316470.1 tyrosine protein phosphatase [Priestia megaterium]